MAAPYTYNPKQCIIALGNHVVSGYADDSFIKIDPDGDDVTKKTGCDGEVNRAISVDDGYNITLALLQNSPTNAFLEAMRKKDKEDGTGHFPILIKDLMGKEKFSSDFCWVSKMATWGRGKDTTNREWTLSVAQAKFETE